MENKEVYLLIVLHCQFSSWNWPPNWQPAYTLQEEKGKNPVQRTWLAQGEKGLKKYETPQWKPGQTTHQGGQQLIA